MDISNLVSRQKKMFQESKTLTHTFRLHQLKKLQKIIERYEKDIFAALKKDLNKSEYESFATEIAYINAELADTIRNLAEWMKPQKVKTPFSHKGSKNYIYSDPYGVTLIIGPWNYPYQLIMAPLIGAIAAGNCAIIKPSEFTPTVSRLIATMIKETFDENYITVVEGDKEVSTELLAQPFDYIFFTGSVPVGKIVMEAASKHLTPVTLELGGKSPCIVDKDAKLDIAARRIAWGKYTNAGQTCIAPDYVYVHEDIKELFIEKLQHAIETLYGENALENKEYTKIVNANHFDRLTAYLQDGTIRIGGQVDKDKLTISPTVMDCLDWDTPVMQDEIFGPILPVFTFTNLKEVQAAVRKAPKPLALYYFSENSQNQEWIIKNITYGGGCINDTMMHFANPHLPFGGVGSSGIGGYHGKYSFDTFSHKKSVTKQTTSFDLSFRYPGSKMGLKILKKVLKKK
ncbi:aldehyde dehydrogenase (NAD+) [Salirhabdus euzebyi]|uniref:Aldehyde dehydrogenase n=1 Tax=Salirhabdus euzebyi TaxID=394506 RepID=A0A841QAV0_9BACI|nr:aldehyde dehydrogenase [Salirhabdus euzebyi]MBB6455347.1 aldehyde dehydrogenase (NAD+) [Salirhabdus euzebyi]